MRALLEKLCDHENLTAPESELAFGRIVRGEADVIEISALLIALRTKGETVDEIAGAARALLAAAKPFPRPDYDTIDCCGTGGDGHGTLNVSTAVAFVLAALRVPVVKHGNRSVSSRSGSSDVLKALGINSENEPDKSRELLDKYGLCFLHAPQYHVGVRYAMPVRQALQLRTLFNLLGPIINPAQPALRLMGVYDAALLERIAQTLQSLQVKRAWVVNGGIDEIALHGVTQVAELKHDEVRLLHLSPEQVGLERQELALLRGGEARDNARELLSALVGQGRPAYRDAIALNAGAGLVLARKVKSLKEGVQVAHTALRDGSAMDIVQALQKESPYVA